MLVVALIFQIDIPQGYIKLRGLSGYWFIPVYLFLYVFSPVLNAYVVSSRPKNYLILLLSFFSFETYFLLQGESFGAIFAYGYSATHFMGLYLLAQFFRKYMKANIPNKPNLYLGAFVLFTLIPVIVSYFGIKYLGRDLSQSIAYSSPFVVAASLSLLLMFDNITVNSKVINWIASSVFAIYLIHMNPIVVPYFMSLMKWGYSSVGMSLYAFFAISVALFGGMLCVLLDKVRILLWRFLCHTFLDSHFGYVKKLYDNFFLKLGL